MHRHPGRRAGRRPLLTTVAVVATLALGALGSCTRTHDLAGPAVDETTTTARVPVRRVPRATTSTTVAPETTTVPAAVEGATTTAAPPATPSRPASRRNTTATTTPLAALLAALRAATATATTVPATPTPTTPTTTTTIIPANPAGVVVTAQNAIVHQGETQTIAVDNDNNPAVPSLVSCAGRDYLPTGGGWLPAGFTSQVDCAVVGDAATLTRTLPANVPFGQYVFCTEVEGATPTTVCTAYVVVPYPT